MKHTDLTIDAVKVLEACFRWIMGLTTFLTKSEICVVVDNDKSKTN